MHRVLAKLLLAWVVTQAGLPYPQGRVTVDGVVVGTVSFNSESWQTQTLTGNWAAGSHKVQVEYTNDSSYRGLILDVVRAMAK